MKPGLDWTPRAESRPPEFKSTPLARGGATTWDVDSGQTPKEAPRDHDRVPAHLDALNLVARAECLRVQPRRSSDLHALENLDLVAEPDVSVAGEMDRERAGGGTGGRVFGNSQRGGEHACLPLAPRAGETVHANRRQRRDCGQIGLKSGDLLPAGKVHEHVAGTVLVQLDRVSELATPSADSSSD